jgi:hypothetical protein
MAQELLVKAIVVEELLGLLGLEAEAVAELAP